MERLHQRLRRMAEATPALTEKRLVFGEGRSFRPDVMLIGEAPGEQESLQGRPFVGKAGKNLDGFLQVLQLQREDIYISNVVKIRPTKAGPTGRLSNRPPNREELALFTPFLLEEVRLVRPRVVVTLGNVALKALCGEKSVIGSMHGRPAETLLPGGEAVAVFPLYHPASIIYNRSLAEVYQADLTALKAFLQG